MPEAPKAHYITENDAMAKARRIIDELDQVPMSQALAIMDKAKELLLAGHMVDADNPRLQRLISGG